jgi:hypothetical protein
MDRFVRRLVPTTLKADSNRTCKNKKPLKIKGFCILAERGIPIIGGSPHGCWVFSILEFGVPPNMPPDVSLAELLSSMT